ncbi:MAG TPA: 3-hydroxyacyl-CoA dehydrogenase NAD-binding domain-containing protein [Acidobacteriaceae bacterium]|nr:3-hydroxyacyl-CoA dehydrogenase NAD-binding domain-containing protein [Acidobacteriaceae bacterium]
MPSADVNDSIQRIAVLGAGTMGGRIAAHIANAGFSVLLLDLVPEGASDRSVLAARSLENLKKAKPPAFVDPAVVRRITVGNFEDDLDKLQACDWILEAVAENLEIKRALLNKVAPYIRDHAIVSTNTSGLPVGLIAKDMPESFRRRWLGTHFFNPPRYMRLVEFIVTPETDARVVASVENFARMHLGKMVVHAHDTPNFIANRIGTFVMLNTFRTMLEQGLSIEETDALTGAAIGWPKTGTFRLADMVGIDVLVNVARNFGASSRDERADVEIPAVLEQIFERKWFGDKTGHGFYKKQPGAEGKEERLVLDLHSLEYRPAERVKMPALEMEKSNESAAARIRALLAADPDRDQVTKFYWRILPELWGYAANRIGEVADTVIDIDRAMRAGFNWELGPFEMWDAAGFVETVEKMRARGQAIPPVVERMVSAGVISWYRNESGEFFDVDSEKYRPVVEPPDTWSVARAKRAHGVVEKNPGASLIDLGNGIACIEFHSKMNTLGEDIVGFVQRALGPGSDATRNFRGFVISNDAANFSVGANLMQVLLAIQDEEWDELDRYVREFQAMTQAIRFCVRPVIVAPSGMCLGGGAEVALHAAGRQSHVELYMGLVETSVGLLPAGGGCKEMTLRAIEIARAVWKGQRSDSVEMHNALRTVFETIAMAKVSSSAAEAKTLHLMRDADGITMNRERLLCDAKSEATKLADAGYVPPLPQADIPTPGEGVLANLKLGIHTMREAEFISDHDVKVARQLAHVLCGGVVTAGTQVSEQHFLDLEREAFLSLCGEPKTVERITATLKTGKPLRN